MPPRLPPRRNRSLSAAAAESSRLPRGSTIEEFDAALHRIYSVTVPDEFPAAVMPLLLDLTGSQCVGLCVNALLPGDPYIAVSFASRPDRAKWRQFPQVSFYDHPTRHYAATPAPRHAIRLTDHFPCRAAIEATRYFREILQPLGLRYEVSLLLDTPLGRRLGISVSRARADYSDAEVELLTRLGPHLQRAFHHVQTLAQLRGTQGRASAWHDVDLTPRESEILRWVATGRTNGAIADLLGVGAATVKTHLEHIFHKLGVSNRAAAAAALRDLPPPERA
jgi:DNA-binding CsgD family transcriptional regulator